MRSLHVFFLHNLSLLRDFLLLFFTCLFLFILVDNLIIYRFCEKKTFPLLNLLSRLQTFSIELLAYFPTCSFFITYIYLSHMQYKVNATCFFHYVLLNLIKMRRNKMRFFRNHIFTCHRVDDIKIFLAYGMSGDLIPRKRSKINYYGLNCRKNEI